MSKQSGAESGLVKFLRFGIYLTAFIPLIIWKDFISPFHFGKVVIFRSLIEILGAGYLILILKNRAYLPWRDKIFWAFFLFAAAFTLTTLTSVLRYSSFWGSLERMGGLWTFWHYFLFFIILTSVLTKREHWQKLLDFTILTGVLSAFYGFFQKTNIEFFLGSGGRERIFGSIGNAALFAGFELLSVFLALTLYFYPQTLPRRRKWYLLAFGIMSVAVLMTAVRGSLLGFVVGLAVFAWLWMKHQNVRMGRLALTIIIGLTVFWGIFSWLFSDSSLVKNSRYLRRVTNLSLTAVTVKTRAWAWQAGLKGWSEGPKTVLLGWGPENFNIPFSKYFNPKFFAGQGSETLYDRAHNMFIEILVTMGLVGLLAYGGVFMALFSSLKKLSKNSGYDFYAIGLIPLVVTYIIHNSFIFDTSPNFIVFFTVAGFISFLGVFQKVQSSILEDKDRTLKPAQTFNPVLANLAAAFLLIFIPVLIYKTNIVPAKANYTLTRAIVRGWNKDVLGAFRKYEEALSYDVPGKYEYRHRFAQYLVGPGAPSVKEKTVREAHLFALDEINKNIKENPIDYLPYLYGSRLSIMLGKEDPKSIYNDRALDYSMKALEFSPTFIRTYYEIAQAYLNKNDIIKAVEFFQKAVDLNPDTGLSWWYLGVAKIQNKDRSGEDDLEKSLTVKNRYNPSESDYLRLINNYLETENFTKIAQTYERLIEVNPANPQYFATLATAYAKLGRIDEAVKMSRRAVAVDSSFEPDAQVFLKSLGREF